MAAVSGPIAASRPARSSRSTWSKPCSLRSEALEILLVSGGRERRQRPAVEGAAERDDPLPLRSGPIHNDSGARS